MGEIVARVLAQRVHLSSCGGRGSDLGLQSAEGGAEGCGPSGGEGAGGGISPGAGDGGGDDSGSEDDMVAKQSKSSGRRGQWAGE